MCSAPLGVSKGTLVDNGIMLIFAKRLGHPVPFNLLLSMLSFRCQNSVFYESYLSLLNFLAPTIHIIIFDHVEVAFLAKAFERILSTLECIIKTEVRS